MHIGGGEEMSEHLSFESVWNKKLLWGSLCGNGENSVEKLKRRIMGGGNDAGILECRLPSQGINWEGVWKRGCQKIEGKLG